MLAVVFGIRFTMAIRINPAFRDLLPHKTAEQKRLLFQMLRTEGIRDPIVIWKETEFIIDGHYRFECASRYPDECGNYAIKRMSFAHEEDVVKWIVDTQLARRNLTDEERTYYIGKLYLTQKDTHGGDRKGSSVQNEHLIPAKARTAEKIAAEQQVSPMTVRRAGDFAQRVDKATPEERTAILKGEFKPAPQPKKRPKPGSEKFDKAGFESDFGKLYRRIDQLARGYGLLTKRGATRETPEILALFKCLKDFKSAFYAYQKYLEANPPTEKE